MPSRASACGRTAGPPELCEGARCNPIVASENASSPDEVRCWVTGSTQGRANSRLGCVRVFRLSGPTRRAEMSANLRNLGQFLWPCGVTTAQKLGGSIETTTSCVGIARKDFHGNENFDKGSHLPNSYSSWHQRPRWKAHRARKLDRVGGSVPGRFIFFLSAQKLNLAPIWNVRPGPPKLVVVESGDCG